MIACNTTWGSWWFNLFTMALKQSFEPFLWLETWSHKSIICPQSSEVFFASVTFSETMKNKGISGLTYEEIVVFDDFRRFFETYRQSRQTGWGPRNSPYWILDFCRWKFNQNELLSKIDPKSSLSRKIFFFCYDEKLDRKRITHIEIRGFTTSHWN